MFIRCLMLLLVLIGFNFIDYMRYKKVYNLVLCLVNVIYDGGRKKVSSVDFRKRLKGNFEGREG